MALARAAAPPWTVRLFETIPLRPASVGVLLAAGLIAIFFLQEFALGRHTLLLDPDDPFRMWRNWRITVFGCLQLSYVTTAYVYLVRSARDAVARLRPVLAGEPEELAQLEATAGRYDRTGMRIAAVVGVSVGLLIPYLGEGENFYTWAANNPETLWHRVTAPLVGY